MAVLAAGTATAGMFSVTPVRIYMNARERAVAVTIVNDGDSDVVLQADLNSWTQTADGTDQLAPTDDLILAPPIIKIPPKARQVVRLALLTPPDLSRQLTYRVVVREVPEARPQPPAEGLRTPIALALSLPVFITPPGARRQVECTPVRTEANAPALSCRNNGNAYAQLRDAQLTRDDRPLARFEGGTYILPGATKLIALKTDTAVPSGQARLSLTFDDGQGSTTSVALP
ncbi:molecular chaperone [Ramlibacter henchirensis]|nr:fimbria/pilus periplasmic chaperone [Ramlibacter henchirensis]